MLLFIPTAYEGAATIKPVQKDGALTLLQVLHDTNNEIPWSRKCFRIALVLFANFCKSGLDLQGIEPLTS